jgi:arylsulfatase A-like enzyme
MLRDAPNLAVPPPYKGWTPPKVTDASLFPAEDTPRQSPRPARRDKAEMPRDYLRTIVGVDENVGRLLDTLDELKLRDNTVVIFASDNGLCLREHEIGDKRAAYEESLRIPLLVRYPKLVKPGLLVDALALNIDLAPTLLDLAGVSVPKQMQGRSWRSLLGGKAPADWRTSFFYEYFWEPPFNTPTNLAVRTNSAKLIRYPGHEEWTELFDLKADPYEMKNLWRDPAQEALRKQMEAEFERQKTMVGFRVPASAQEATRAAGAGGN